VVTIASIIDGSWVDIGSSVCAAGAGLFRSRRPGADRNKIIVDFLNGGTLFPFLVMMSAVFSSSVLQAVETSSRGTFFLAGGVGVVWVLAELKKA
jgi:hypothetical protein